MPFLAGKCCRLRSEGNRNFHYHVLSLPGAKVPPMELSLLGTFAPWNFRSLELSLPLFFWLFTYDVIIVVKVIVPAFFDSCCFDPCVFYTYVCAAICVINDVLRD